MAGAGFLQRHFQAVDPGGGKAEGGVDLGHVELGPVWR